jgi:uncharacterized protein (UPF0333 family)
MQTLKPSNLQTFKPSAHRRSGQTALEYILIFALLLLAAGAAYHFMRAPADVATFTTDVICSERL